MSDYSRSQKPKKDKVETKKKISEGVNAFHKGIAILGSILGLITASITIYNFTHKDEDKSTKDSSTSTVIIQQGGNTESQSSLTTSDSTNTETVASTETTPASSAVSETSTASQANSTATDTTPATENTNTAE